MSPLIHPVLLCGGSGTRLWPLSRQSEPKQFAKVIGDETLFQSTAGRFAAENFAPPIVVTSANFCDLALDQLRAADMVCAEVLVEPAQRNTAAAVCVSALSLEARHPGALMLVCPTDHRIADAPRFREAVRRGIPEACKGNLVTFGIRPDRPETGYGWLEPEGGDQAALGAGVQKLKAFIEKPPLAKAQDMLSGRLHLWNSGIFLFRASSILNAYAMHAPLVLDLANASLQGATHDGKSRQLASGPWENLPNISIDYAIMEKAENVCVVPYDGAWSDLGDWEAVWRESARDASGTATTSRATAIDCRNTLLHAVSDDQRLVGIGLDDMIAVAMPDAVIVARKSRAQDVRRAVEQMKSEGAPQAGFRATAKQGPGPGEQLASGPGFAVRHIVVRPGDEHVFDAQLGHTEYLIIVEGVARITQNGNVTRIAVPGAVRVSTGTSCRLENPGTASVSVIMVRAGDTASAGGDVRHENSRHTTPGMKSWRG